VARNCYDGLRQNLLRASIGIYNLGSTAGVRDNGVAYAGFGCALNHTVAVPAIDQHLTFQDYDSGSNG
jgi:hypothetical protein